MAREGDQAVILGIASFGSERCGGTPTVYQAVGPLINWIESVIGEELPTPD